ncbi:MAG: YwaF family protein [Clostridiales bacterium]|nr:YwaF family protein [Clostridiales bacterium]MDY3747640.1 YwaF family protein [Lachnospiraceae bacterium]
MNMEWFIVFLSKTAWKMDVWQVGGKEHFLVAVFGLAAAIAAAVIMAKKIPHHTKAVYLIAGNILLVSEVYKQLFNYLIINQRHYMWELLPFQLCSLPMYLCLWIPWVKSNRFKRCLNTFLVDFNVLGAVMVFVDPSGLFHGYWTLTLHGILWHLLIVTVGIYAGLTEQGAHKNMKGFVYALPVYAIAAASAVAINVLIYPYEKNINMFYLNPFEPSMQIVFRDIAAKFGITAGNICYYLAIAAGALLVHWIVFKSAPVISAQTPKVSK